jgi:dihydroorotase
LKTLLKKVKIVEKGSIYDGLIKDILVEQGVIIAIDDDINVIVDAVYDIVGSSLSIGWCDMRVHGTLPGGEHREDLNSLSNAAIAGGFTDICVLPNTNPVVQAQEMVNYVKSLSNTIPITIYPYAAATHQAEGKDINEYIDLSKAGAIGFTDGSHSIDRLDTLQKVMQYLGQVDGLFLNNPTENSLTKYGQMYEGLQSDMLGLKGIPAYAEKFAVQKHILMMEYLGTKPKVHFSTISTAAGVELIRKAKADGYNITCDVAIHNLLYTDTDLVDFDTNLKVFPPLGANEDKEALWKALTDGTINAIVSDHNPQEAETKVVEFDVAEFGISGIETVFAALVTNNKNLNYAEIVHLLANGPRKVLQLDPIRIEVGQKARFTLFDITKEWTPSLSTLKSKAKNSPFIGKTMKGKPLAIFTDNTITYVD